MTKKTKTVCIICSAGGHLRQASQLMPVLDECNRYWVTFKKKDAAGLLKGEKVYWGYYPTQRSIINFFRNFFLAVKIFYRNRTDVLISTGAGIAVPFFMLGKITGKKLIFIESFSRVSELSLTGKIIYRFCSNFLVQWKNLEKQYPGATYRGKLL